tara:strand:- start:130 stop:1329 length:1200 start_codon:yes stop_codon:yes gene_type:complete
VENKKLAIIGKGTAGSIVASYFLPFLEGRGEIDWYYNPNLPEQAVGEGTALEFPKFLSSYLNLNILDLYTTLDGTQKTSIRKINYKGSGDYLHHFPLGSNGIHFNANKFQKYVFETFKNRINLIPKNIISHSNIDATHIIDCSGKPKTYNDFNILDSIPVNSTFITQCFWDSPKFNYTFTIARPYGWVFLIPLQNRCSVGYLFNHKINNIEDIKLDLKDIFKEYGLFPSDKTNTFNFKNYYRKENYTDRVSYNGNASFFLEPLEATSISTIQNLCNFNTVSRTISKEELNLKYKNDIKEIEQMIMLHYFAGSKYDTPFWKHAYEKSLPCIEEMTKNPKFKSLLQEVYYNLQNPYKPLSNAIPDFGTWGSFSFSQNLINLGILEKINNLVNKNQSTTNFL